MKVKLLMEMLRLADRDADVVILTAGRDAKRVVGLLDCKYTPSAATSPYVGKVGVLKITEEERKRGWLDSDVMRGRGSGKAVLLVCSGDWPTPAQGEYKMGPVTSFGAKNVDNL